MGEPMPLYSPDACGTQRRHCDTQVSQRLTPPGLQRLSDFKTFRNYEVKNPTGLKYCTVPRFRIFFSQTQLAVCLIGNRFTSR